MVARVPITFNTLPLFASDREIAEAVVGRDREKVEGLLSSIPRLEACGFPKPTPGYGRYVPAVKDFYDRVHLSRTAPLPPDPANRPKDGPWRPERKTLGRKGD